MECCHPTYPLSPCEPCTPRLDPTLKPQVDVVGKVLNYLISPEASNREQLQPDPLGATWMGPLKGLLWTGVSIAAGSLLALLCS